MKKIALFVSVLLLAGSLFAAAPAFEAKPGISGSATMTFGVNLDNSATGISNATDANITLGLISKATDEKGGKEGEVVYGWIKLKDFEMKIAAGDSPTLTATKPGIEAKLFLGPVYINILGDGASTGKTLVTGILNDKDTNGVFDILSVGTTTNAANVEYKNKESTEQKGIVIGLVDTSIVDVQLGVNSLYDWTSDGAGAMVDASTYKWVDATSYTLATSEVYTGVTGTWNGVVLSQVQSLAYTQTAVNPANTANVYNFWGALGLKAVAGLTAELKAGFTTAASSPFGLGVKVGYDIAVAENIKITPMVGFDMNVLTAMAYRLSAGVNVSLPGTMLDDWDKFGTKQDIKPGVSVLFAVDSATTPNMDLTVALFDGDLIPVLNLVAVGEVFGLTSSAMKIGLGAFASADLGVVVPYAGFQTKMTGSSQSNMIFQVGTDIKVITNTTFTLAYKSGDLSLATPGKGIITFATKIAY